VRTLERNKREFWACAYVGRTEIADEGHATGEYAITYGEPVLMRGNVTAASGNAELEQFGIGVEYDRVIQLPGTDWDVDEHTVLFLDREPPEDFDPTNVPYDYTITRVSKSLNHTSLAVSKVRR
jgi:hypothetical protein